MNVKIIKNVFIFVSAFFFVLLLLPATVHAISVPTIDMQIGSSDDPAQVANSLQILLLISVITLAPTLIIMVTCFPRIIISLHFLRSAMGTQQMPPNQVLIGIALFLTIFQMSPVFARIYDEAWVPYTEGRLSQEAAFTNGMEPLRNFMIAEVEEEDVALFFELSGESVFAYPEIPTRILIPAFMLGEVRKGFYAGFYIYIPFIIIDMVVASILMAMGMMMLPPAMISLPFKILVFLAADGWTLFIGAVMRGFRS